VNNDRRVVITGLGALTPLGNDVETFWQNLKNGVSGIHKIEAFDTSAYDCKIGGEVRGFDPKAFGARIDLLNLGWPRRKWRSKTAESIWRS
jgi:3-oxoacyl-(acyl-carrier-protein) synthase